MSEVDLGIPIPDYFLALLRSKIADAGTLRDIVLRASKIKAAEAAERNIIDGALENYEKVIEEAWKKGEELSGRKWDGRIYASIRKGVFREVCSTVGLEDEDEREILKKMSAKL